MPQAEGSSTEETLHSMEMVTTLRRMTSAPGRPSVPDLGPEDVASSGFVVEWQLRPVRGPECDTPAAEQAPMQLSELGS